MIHLRFPKMIEFFNKYFSSKKNFNGDFFIRSLDSVEYKFSVYKFLLYALDYLYFSIMM